MPNRIIKESICRSDNLDRLSSEEERFFYRLMVQCDDYGRYDGRPAIIKGACFPLKSYITPSKVDKMLAALRDAALIFVYVVDGLPYIQMAKWEKHQQIRAKRSKYPEPNGDTLDLLSPAIIGNQPISLDGTCPRNPIQSNPNPIRNPIQSMVENDSTDRFEIFWKEFLAMKRNDGKVEARKAWITTTVNGRPGKNGHKPVEPSVIIQAAKHYRAFCEAEETEPRYIKRPASFLGPDRHWEDWKKPRQPSKQKPADTSSRNQRLSTPEDLEELKAFRRES